MTYPRWQIVNETGMTAAFVGTQAEAEAVFRALVALDRLND